MGPMGSASYSCTPLMLLKSNSSCKGGPFPEHIVHPRENKLWLCCQSKHSRDAAGADNGRHKGGWDHTLRRGGRERQKNFIGVQWLRRIARLNWKMVEQKRNFRRGGGKEKGWCFISSVKGRDFSLSIDRPSVFWAGSLASSPTFTLQGKLLLAVLLRQREHVKNTGFLEWTDYFRMGKILRFFLFLLSFLPSTSSSSLPF